MFPKLAARFHVLPKLPQKYRSRILDSEYNMILAYALDRLPTLLTSIRSYDRTLLIRLANAWAGVGRALIDVRSCAIALQSGAPPGYRVALQLASIILSGCDFGRSGGQFFSLSLSDLWEKALLRMCHELSRTSGWVPQPVSHRFWEDPTESSDNRRWMKADVLLRQGDVQWVMDAKYKLGFGNESREDRFQICTYALAFDASRASLLYPSAQGESVTLQCLLNASVGHRRVRIESGELPMAAGPDVCLRALAHVLSG